MLVVEHQKQTIFPSSINRFNVMKVYVDEFGIKGSWMRLYK